MTKRLHAVVAIVLILAMCGLGLHVALHWHGEAYGDQACQACHAGHTAMPQPVAQLAERPSGEVQRYVAAEAPLISLAPIRTHPIPRAPPTSI